MLNYTYYIRVFILFFCVREAHQLIVSKRYVL